MLSVLTTAQRLVMRAHSALYRATGGKVAGKVGGNPVLLLTTTGRKSGQQRTTPLLYLADAQSFVVVASAGGAPKHPAWWLNLKTNPEATIEVGERRMRVQGEEAGPEEKARLWPKLVAMYSGYSDYQRKTNREIPIGILHPVSD